MVIPHHCGLLKGSTIMHCAAVCGAVHFASWAVSDPSLYPLLLVCDQNGLTPLALAAKCQADLLRPLFYPQVDSDEAKAQHTRRSKEKVAK